MEFRSIARQGRAVAVVTCCLLMGSWTVQSCKDEYTLTGQPSWLGNYIYQRLQEEGNYTTLLRLVDDLEQTGCSATLVRRHFLLPTTQLSRLGSATTSGE